MINTSNVKYAKDGAAWKTATMRGYIKKTVLDAETYGAGAYKLTFVKADGTQSDFFFDNGTGTTSTSLILDKDLLENILDPSWQAGTAAEFEEARTATSSW